MPEGMPGQSSTAFSQHRVLVLNADFTPMGSTPETCSAEEAVTAVFLERVIVVKPSDVWARSAEGYEMNVPSVIALTKYAPQHALYQPATFNQDNLFIRDQATCMYGGQKVKWKHRDPKHQATIEHIHPRSQGGALSWENCVLVSAELNSRKADNRLDQMNRHKRQRFTPLLEPWVPTCAEIMALNHLHYAEHPFWAEYLATIKPTRRVLEVMEKLAA